MRKDGFLLPKIYVFHFRALSKMGNKNIMTVQAVQLTGLTGIRSELADCRVGDGAAADKYGGGKSD